MKLDQKKVDMSKCVTVSEFIKIVRERTGKQKTGKQVIYYHLQTGKLDYIDWCGMKLIVQNDKAEQFAPGTYYKNSSIARKKNKKNTN